MTLLKQLGGRAPGILVRKVQDKRIVRKQPQVNPWAAAALPVDSAGGQGMVGRQYKQNFLLGQILIGQTGQRLPVAEDGKIQLAVGQQYLLDGVAFFINIDVYPQGVFCGIPAGYAE